MLGVPKLHLRCLKLHPEERVVHVLCSDHKLLPLSLMADEHSEAPLLSLAHYVLAPLQDLQYQAHWPLLFAILELPHAKLHTKNALL